MRKFIGAGLFIVAALLLVFGLTTSLPKYVGFLRLYFFFLLLDAGLWFFVWKTIKGFSRPLQLLAGLVYWSLPLLAIASLVTGLIIPFLSWPIAFRTYLVSILLILVLVKIPPMTMWAVSMLYRFIRRMITYGNREKTNPGSFSCMGRLVFAGWIAGFIVFIVMLGGMIFGQFAFTVSRNEIILKDLPESFDGFRIVQVSDVHLGSWTCRKKLAEAVDSINSLHPDVIFFTGDMFNYFTGDGNDFGETLSRLKAVNGIYTILGNHDYGEYITWPDREAKKRNMDELKTWYNRLGWKLLLNSHDFIRRGNDSIAIIGVENWGATRRFQRKGNIEKAQTGTEQVSVQLLLSHDPSYWDIVISKKYQNIDVTFSGHTHGGQVGISTNWLKWSPSSWAYPHWSGLYRNDQSSTPQFLYVNQGLGNIGYAGRIGILPEITLVVLKNRK